MDATCKVQDNIHVFRLVHNMCPGFWVHISEGSFEIDDLEIFENVAYIMAYHADRSIAGNIDDWLDQFEMFSIYEILPEILELRGVNLETEVQSKKNFQRVAGK